MTLELNSPAAAVSARVDKTNGIIFGVSVATAGRVIGHPFTLDEKSLQTIAAVANTYPGGVHVKLDHGSGVAEIIGRLTDFRVDADRVRADLRLLKSHPRYVSLLEIAEMMPGVCGLSISISGEKQEIDGKSLLRCSELYSVDLVDRPAANPNGLFSSTPSGISDDELERVARHVFGDREVDSWRQNTPQDFSSVMRRNFHFRSLSVPGLDTRKIEEKFGAPKKPFGLQRLEQSRHQTKVNEYFTQPKK